MKSLRRQTRQSDWGSLTHVVKKPRGVDYQLPRFITHVTGEIYSFTVINSE